METATKIGNHGIAVSLSLSPGDAPTTVDANVPDGAAGIPVSAPVEPADGSIESCEPTASP